MRLNLLLLAFALLAAAPAEAQRAPARRAARSVSTAPAAEATVAPGGRRAAARVGRASFYAPRFHGRRTANGERYNHQAMTVAHRTLPFGTRLRVTNERNGRSVVVRVNDRGPFHGNRVLDLSGAAARRLGIGGVGSVRYEVLGRGRAADDEVEPAAEDPSAARPPQPFINVKPRHV